MLAKKYLTGLDADDFDIPGIFGVRDSRKPQSWRILCSYADGKRHKKALFAKLAAGGQAEAAKTWDFHHVLEGQHFADICFTGDFSKRYLEELPCVLIAKEEHTAYNRLLHTSAADELFRDGELPRALATRATEVAADARDRRKHPKLRLRAEQIARMYREAYEGDYVLTQVSHNVVLSALRELT